MTYHSYVIFVTYDQTPFIPLQCHVEEIFRVILKVEIRYKYQNCISFELINMINSMLLGYENGVMMKFNVKYR